MKTISIRNFSRLNERVGPETNRVTSSVPSASVLEMSSSQLVVVPPSQPLIQFRAYQREAFLNRTTGIELWLWARQVGKSFTLAAWAVDRLITIPGWTVTILSNSVMNGIELNRKCAEVCRLMGRAFQQVDLSRDDRFENMKRETRITVHGRTGRIIVLAANPLTARGFSGDLILDEFAFHEDSAAIWTEASPILAGNKNYLCRIASTPNGKHNHFYSMITEGRCPVRKITRTDAHSMGCPVFHPITRAAITPAEARALEPNKRAYDQNFECAFEDQNMSLLTHELINAAERPNVGIVCAGDWTPAALDLLKESLPFEDDLKTARQWIEQAADEGAMRRHISLHVCNGSADRYDELLHSEFTFRLKDSFDGDSDLSVRPQDTKRNFFVGVDVGRNNDRTVISVLERTGHLYQLRAVLRLEQMRLPQQQERLEQVLRLPCVRLAKIDMTGLGLGLVEYTQHKLGAARVQGVNFASSVPLSALASREGIRNVQSAFGNGNVRITEAMATQLLQVFEDRSIHLPIDSDLREDLRKPERLLSPGGRVSIAATRDAAGHADHFWSLALALDAAHTPIQKPFQWHSWKPRAYRRVARL